MTSPSSLSQGAAELLPGRTARFVEAELHYGAIRGTFSFPEVGRPLVIFGANGAGKSTFIEALTRGIYGFNPRNREDKARLEERSPWNSAVYRTAITLAAGGDLWTIERDFVSLEFGLRRGGAEAHGEPVETDETRAAERLEALVGLRDLESYAETAVLHQGTLERTRLGDHLLRIAAGGHTPVEDAKRRVERAHAAITGGALGAESEPGGAGGRFQHLEGELLELRGAIERARAAEDRRAPIVAEIDALQTQLDGLEAEIEALNEIGGRLAERRALEAERGRIRQRRRIVRDLAEAHDEARAEESELRMRGERIAERGPVSALTVAGVVLVLAGAAASLYGFVQQMWVAGGVLAGLALCVAGALAVHRWKRARARFERQTRLRMSLDRAEERRREIEGRIERTLAESDSEREAVPEGDGLREHLTHEEAALDAAEASLVRQIEESSPGARRLPEGVPPEADAIASAIEERRTRAGSLTRALNERKQQLLEEASPSLPSLVLEHRASEVERTLAALRRRSDAHQRAYALLRDAYAAFRERDQDRLVRRVSEHILALSGGRLGPVEVHGSLADATVRVEERTGVIESPPLSWGELHLAALGIRLGGIDFLSSAGVLPPLLADDPFGHLDDDRVAAFWRLLHEVSSDRQVVVTVHSRRLLDALEVEPDLILE